MADFMQEQVTRKMDWYKIDGTMGITFLPMDDGPNHILVKAACGDADELQELFGDFYNGTVQDVEPVMGYGARLSAPGYMDCTEWAVFDTAEQAAEYLTETYGDDYPDAEARDLGKPEPISEVTNKLIREEASKGGFEVKIGFGFWALGPDSSMRSAYEAEKRSLELRGFKVKFHPDPSSYTTISWGMPNNG